MDDSDFPFFAFVQSSLVDSIHFIGRSTFIINQFVCLFKPAAFELHWSCSCNNPCRKKCCIYSVISIRTEKTNIASQIKTTLDWSPTNIVECPSCRGLSVLQFAFIFIRIVHWVDSSMCPYIGFSGKRCRHATASSTLPSETGPPSVAAPLIL